MNVLIVPDKFKGSLSAAEAANAIGRGVHQVMPTAIIDLFPMADGGEGTVAALVAATEGKLLRRRVCGPLGKPVLARFGLLGGKEKVAVIEMAEASGLHLVAQKQLNPLRTTTYGTGELIQAALQMGCNKIIVGIGGSATVDGGAGMAQALGWKFFDKDGLELLKPLTGGDLDRIIQIQSPPLSHRQSPVVVRVACDVTNPLLGKTGAARIFGPQKGATPAMVKQLEKNLGHYSKQVAREVRLGPGRAPVLTTFAGAGAAGGIGYGLKVFLDAQFSSGADLVMRYGGMDAKLRRADLVITGEGKLDQQSLGGKAPVRVARRAKTFGLPVLALAGSVTVMGRELKKQGICAAASIKTEEMSLKYAVQHAARILEDTTAKLFRGFMDSSKVTAKRGER